MSDTDLATLCSLAGLATRWQDVFGKTHDVAEDDLRLLLARLGLPADDAVAVEGSIATLRDEAEAMPPLLTADPGGTVVLPLGRDETAAFRITLEHGGTLAGDAVTQEGRLVLFAPAEPGYHRLEIAGRETILAVAPPRCFTPRDALGPARESGKGWGLAVQLYALRRHGDGGVGDFAALTGFLREAANAGADALAISPVHAQFSADPDRFSPYAPSSRVMLNVLHLAAENPGEEAARLEELALIDWPAVARDRLVRLRNLFAARADDAAFSAWRTAQGDAVERHAVFEALHARLWKETGAWHWQHWPEAYRDADSDAVAAFAREHRDEVDFHAWLQFRADTELQAAQDAAREDGMAIGLIADLAVGTDSGGSHCWSRREETLLGLSVGAPPDLLQPDGQNWGITAFSARGLRQTGFRAYIEMLRAAMRHAGGVRIDHAMGINRLWIIPEGKTAGHGSYLSFPETDLLRLIRLESQRNRAIVLAEDLGTVPDGFQERLQAAGVDGMRVLWFEREETAFSPPERWTAQAAAMTSTHDLPTVAGWWHGHDISLRAGIGASEERTRHDREERERDRPLLWAAFQASGAARGEIPAAWDTFPIVDAAIAHAGRSACELVMLPVEDALALIEQPNLPGTTDEHPNWRRRLEAPVGHVLDTIQVAARLALLDRLRRGPV